MTDEDCYKNDLRTWAKAKRKELDIERISRAFVDKLCSTDEYFNAKNVMLFYPKKYEINLLDLLDDISKNFYLPKTNGTNLLCCPFKKGDKLLESYFKVKEPLTEPVDKSKIDLVIVPALACDLKNYRLGYGGGFYDRFLKGMKANKISCVPKELIVETIFPKSFDIPLDKVLTI